MAFGTALAPLIYYYWFPQQCSRLAVNKADDMPNSETQSDRQFLNPDASTPQKDKRHFAALPIDPKDECGESGQIEPLLAREPRATPALRCGRKSSDW
jgi:hypothetical protein